jgi:hypothetical protein
MADERIRGPYETANIEAQEIRALIPERGVHIGVRAQANALIRQRLPVLTDIALANLMLGSHDLSRREFLTRLRGHRIEQIEAPFLIMEHWSLARVDRAGLFQELAEETVRCAPSTPIDRMVDLVDRFSKSPMGRDDREVFARVLSMHPEMDVIAEQFMAKKNDVEWYVSWIDEVKQSAERIKLERNRQQKP